jgi:hypothetical protein
MGLEEKRWIRQFQDEYLPSVRAELKDLVKTDIPYEVDWESFSSDLPALQTLQDQMGRLNSAFRSIVQSSIGGAVVIDAIKDGLKKIVVKNVASPAEKKLTLKDGTLEMLTACGKSGGFLIEGDMRPIIEAGL